MESRTPRRDAYSADRPSVDAAIDLANTVIKAYGERFQAYWLAGMRAKIGLANEEDGDLELIQSLLATMQQQGADFTLAFRRLAALAADGDVADFAATFNEPQLAASWLESWRERLARDPQTPAARAAAMRKVNPAFIPRNHQIEQAIEAAIEDGDFSLFEALLRVLATPYQDQPALRLMPSHHCRQNGCFRPLRHLRKLERTSPRQACRVIVPATCWET